MLWLGLLVALAAQESAAPAQPAVTTSQKTILKRPSGRVFFHPERTRIQLNSDVCYTIRSYIFEAKDGSSPALVGQSTCTPATAGSLRVSKPAKGRLVPL